MSTFNNEVGQSTCTLILLRRIEKPAQNLERIRHDRRVQGLDPDSSSEILPWVHRVFGNLETWLRGTFHGVSLRHLPRYLDEFTYRFDRRWCEEELFGFVLQRAVQGEPFPYARLVAEAAG